MKTLDNLLYARALESVQTKLETASDLSTWTTDNRDYKLKEIQDATLIVSGEALDIVRELLVHDKKDGRCLLEYMIIQELVGVELEVLKSFRDILDTVDDQAASTLPVTHDWLNDKIRQAYQKAIELDGYITEEQESPGQAEEL